MVRWRAQPAEADAVGGQVAEAEPLSTANRLSDVLEELFPKAADGESDEEPGRESGPTVYLAGPDLCCDGSEMDWRAAAKLRLPRTIDPRDRTDASVDGDKEDIDHSDVVLVNYAPAADLLMQMMYAHAKGRRVVVWAYHPNLGAWVGSHAAVVTDFEAALAACLEGW